MQYGTEIRIHEALLASRVRTLDPEEADLFFVPAYGECYLYRAAQQLGPQRGLDDANAWFRNLTGILSHERPWWNRTQARAAITRGWNGQGGLAGGAERCLFLSSVAVARRAGAGPRVCVPGGARAEHL